MRIRVMIAALAMFAVALGPWVSEGAGPTDVAGVPAAQVGLHGPIADFASGQVELVHHVDMTPVAGTTPLGNNGALALIDDCVYVGRWHDYSGANPIQIVDLSLPTPAVVGGVTGSAVSGAVAREIRAVDLPTGFKLLTVQLFSKYTDEGITKKGLNALQFYTFPSGDCRQPVLTGTMDLRPFRPHEFFQWIDPNPAHDVDGHPRILEYVTTPLGGVDMVVVDASHLTAPKLIGFSVGLTNVSPREQNLADGIPVGVGAYPHSISISTDGTRAYISNWDGGFLTLDTSDFAKASPVAAFRPLPGVQSLPYVYGPAMRGNTHSAVVPTGTNTAVVGDEIYVTTDGCPFGWLRTVDIGSLLQRPSQVGEFRLAENQQTRCNADGRVNSRNSAGFRIDGSFSMHNQTVTKHHVLTTWYGGGLRVVDITNRRVPTQIGAFVPKPVETIASVPDTPAPVYGKTTTTVDDWWVASWSYPIIRDGLIYFVDMRNGLYILRPTSGSALESELASIDFLEGNSNLGAFL